MVQNYLSGPFCTTFYIPLKIFKAELFAERTDGSLVTLCPAQFISLVMLRIWLILENFKMQIPFILIIQIEINLQYSRGALLYSKYQID